MQQHNVTDKKVENSIDKIIKGLSQKPAYLLLFGICVLLFGTGSALGLAGVALKQPGMGWTGVVLVALTLCFTTVIIIKVEAIASQLPVGAVGDSELEPIFAAIHENIRQALRVQHPVFHDWLKKECSEFRASSSRWSHGELDTRRRKYNELLVEIYARAETSVFATATEDYLYVWDTPLGKAILQAHTKSSATVERMFIFESLGKVTDNHLRMMQLQEDSGKVKVLVYGIKEHETFDIPAMNHNFAFVDSGGIIASTDPSTGDVIKGRFYFKDANQIFSYNEVISSLKDGSIPLQDFKTSRSPTELPSKT
jgi:hypothetical protein